MEVDEEAIDIGDAQSGLVVAKRCNVVTDLLNLPSGNIRDAEDLVDTDESVSIGVIRTLKELSRLRKDHQMISNDIHKQLLYHESFDYVHPKSLDPRTALLSTLLEYFTDIISNTTALVARLQQSLTADPDHTHSLKMSAAFQKEFCKVLVILSKLVNSFSSYLSATEYVRDEFRFKNDIAKINKFADVVHVLLKCKESTQTMQEVHSQLLQRQIDLNSCSSSNIVYSSYNLH